ncbi:hypothetical protein ECP03022938_3285 [Escherichia coli P0302293.8]|nr:hypothetical protein ECP03022937_4801 [Escherichia coli P0302293.7]ENE19741.1 hypothetical protein ECP030229310_3136 [Escherichia coli P0302293.10]ENE26157.1 hypothetical protein ECP03022934_5006 [Escherichia coli P0302293.4]ENE40273.1 hypothetical protein ECP03022938_3285 [Escherichia coli P0302293.8]
MSSFSPLCFRLRLLIIMGISSPIFRCMNIGDELKLRSCMVVMNQQAYN